MSHVAPAASIGRAARSFQPPGAVLPAESPPADHRIEVPLDAVAFRRVHGPDDLRRVAHLRDAIELPPGVRDAPAFARLEKKKTRWAWSARSNATVSSSARSGCCP